MRPWVLGLCFAAAAVLGPKACGALGEDVGFFVLVALSFVLIAGAVGSREPPGSDPTL